MSVIYLKLPVTMLIHATSFVDEAYDINDKIKILIANFKYLD